SCTPKPWAPASVSDNGSASHPGMLPPANRAAPQLAQNQTRRETAGPFLMLWSFAASPSGLLRRRRAEARGVVRAVQVSLSVGNRGVAGIRAFLSCLLVVLVARRRAVLLLRCLWKLL